MDCYIFLFPGVETKCLCCHFSMKEMARSSQSKMTFSVFAYVLLVLELLLCTHCLDREPIDIHPLISLEQVKNKLLSFFLGIRGLGFPLTLVPTLCTSYYRFQSLLLIFFATPNILTPMQCSWMTLLHDSVLHHEIEHTFLQTLKSL